MEGLRDRKKQQTRDALIRAALELVAERGIEHVTVEDISAVAGVSTRTFFNYFAAKDEPLTGDHLLIGDELAVRLAEVPADVPPLAALRSALGPAVQRMHDAQALWMLRMNVLMANPQLLPQVIAAGGETERGMAALVAGRTGLRPDDSYPMLVAAVVSAAFRVAMCRWAFNEADRHLGDLLDEAFDSLAGGLPGPAPHTPRPDGRIQGADRT